MLPYRDRVAKGIWLRLDEDQETIIALKAQLTQHYGGGKKKKTTTKKPLRKDDAAWKTLPPKSGEPKKKQATVNGTKNTYYWCPHHMKWTIHKPQDCRKKGMDRKSQVDKKKVSNPEVNKDKGKENEPSPSLQVLTATLQDTDSDHETDLINLLP